MTPSPITLAISPVSNVGFNIDLVPSGNLSTADIATTTVSIPDDASTYEVVLTSVVDTSAEPSETGFLQINTSAAGNGFATASPDTVSLTIIDPVSLVSFSDSSSINLNEGGGTTLAVNINPPSPIGMTAIISPSGGLDGTDIGGTGTFSIPANSSSVIIPISAVADATDEDT